MFIVGYLDPGCAGKILPDREANPEALIRIAGRKQGYTVYDSRGLACTQTANTGGLGKGCGLYLVGFNRKEGVTGELTEAHTLQAGDFRGLNRNQTQNAVFVDSKETWQTRRIDNTSCLHIRNHSGEKNCVINLGNINPSGRGQSGCVYHADGLSPTLTTNKGAGIKVMVAEPDVLSGQHIPNAQQGQRNKEDVTSMLARTEQDKHSALLIREATKRGYKEAYDGDSVYLGYPTTNKRRARVGTAFAHTLDTGSSQGVVLKGRIRRLMPRECFRLQGFPDDMIDRMLAVTSDAQAYKQAGNSVTVNVVEAIGRRLRAVDEERKAGTAK